MTTAASNRPLHDLSASVHESSEWLLFVLLASCDMKSGKENCRCHRMTPSKPVPRRVWPTVMASIPFVTFCCVNILRCLDICHVVFTLLFVYISVPYFIYMCVCVCLCVYYVCTVVVYTCLTRKSNCILIGIRNGGTEKNDFQKLICKIIKELLKYITI
jgi:hypothetical protein